MNLSLQCYRLDNAMVLLVDDIASKWVLGRLERSGIDLDDIDPEASPEAYLEIHNLYVELKAKLDAAAAPAPTL